MKQVLLLFTMLAFTASIYAQNVQLHYDFGEGRKHLTSTVEMFKTDKLGSTFFFIDMDYGSNDVEGISLAYWEIARAFNLGKSPFAFHAEYNGGFGQYTPGSTFQINDAWLTGIEYIWNAEDFSKGFTLQALYKYIRGKHNTSFQLTGVWYLNFANNKLSFTGFADFWREDMFFNVGTSEEKTTKFVFLAEPQIWYNISEKFAVGSEVEISSNFVANSVKIMPTAAVKYTF